MIKRYTTLNWTTLDFSVTEDVDDESGERTYAYVNLMQEYNEEDLLPKEREQVKSVDGQLFCVAKGLCEARFVACFNRGDDFTKEEVQEQFDRIDYEKKAVCMDCGIFVTVTGHKERCPAYRFRSGRVRTFAKQLQMELPGGEEKPGVKALRQSAGGEIVDGTLFGFSAVLASELCTAKPNTVEKFLQEVDSEKSRHAICSRCNYLVVYKDHVKRCKRKENGKKAVEKVEEKHGFKALGRVGADALNAHFSTFWFGTGAGSERPLINNDDVKDFIINDEGAQYLICKYGLMPDRSAKSFRAVSDVEYACDLRYRVLLVRYLIKKVGWEYDDCFDHILYNDIVLNSVRKDSIEILAEASGGHACCECKK